MMPFAITIQMSGLLLLTPMPNGPVHVLYPNPDGLGPHVAELGFERFPGAVCDRDRGDGICWIDLHAMAVEIQPPARANTSRVRLPSGADDLSTRFQAPVPSRFFTQSPGNAVRARVTVHSGSVTSSCGIGVWTFERPNSLASDVRELTNVVRWRIRSVPGDSLVLVLRPLNRTGSDTLPRKVTVKPNRGGTMKLFIQHTPTLFATPVFLTSTLAVRLQALRTVLAAPRADHYRAYYEMLGVRDPQSQPVPSRLFPYILNCQWGLNALHALAPGTYSCMVASGTT